MHATCFLVFTQLRRMWSPCLKQQTYGVKESNALTGEKAGEGGSSAPRRIMCVQKEFGSRYKSAISVRQALSHNLRVQCRFPIVECAH